MARRFSRTASVEVLSAPSANAADARKRMEEEAVRVVGAVFEVKKQTHMLPLVLQVLEQRIGVQADEGDTPASQALPAPTADDAAKKEGVKSQRRG